MEDTKEGREDASTAVKHRHLEDRRSAHTPLDLACHNSSTMRRRLSSTTTDIRKTMAMAAATVTMGVVMIRDMEDKIKVTVDNMMTETTREARQRRITLSKTTLFPDPMAAMDPLLKLLLPVPAPAEVDHPCKVAEPGPLVRCVLLQTTAGVLQLPISRVVAATLRARDGVIRSKAPVRDQALRIELWLQIPAVGLTLAHRLFK